MRDSYYSFTALRGGFVFLFCTFCATLPGQVILTEIMNNPAGGETSIPGGDSNEFIEVYNAGSDSVDLTDWSFSDGDSDDDLAVAEGILSPLPDDPDGIYNSLILPPGGFALILDPEYTDPANDQPYNWPEGTLILTIASTSDLGGSRLATTDPITLFDNSGSPVDSFPDPFDPGDGISAERTSIEGSGWEDCNSPSGNTAGARNSHWPYSNDLSLDSLTTPENPATETPVTVYAHISNAGENPVSGAVIELYDSPDTIVSHLLGSEDLIEIPVGETRVIEFSVNLVEGSYELYGKLSNDDNIANNSNILSLFVGPSGWPICISEIMFMPVTGEPEWIELYNWGEEDIDLTGWQFGDEVGLYDIPPCTLTAGAFLVLIEDSIIFADTLCEGSILIQPEGWPALNNSGDVVRLYDDAGLPRHSILYTDDQFGTCMDNGISAEAIEEGSSQLACSPGGRTPGCENAVWFITPGTASIYAEPNPFDPTIERTTVYFELPSGGIEVYVYDRMGRRIASLADPEHPVGLELPWDGCNDDGEILPSGMYILFAKDAEGHSAKSVVALEGGR